MERILVPDIDDSQDDPATVIDYLLSHKLTFVREFLRKKSEQLNDRTIHSSGTRSELRDHLLDCVYSDTFQLEELIDLLHSIEGWGDQHIYLYDLPRSFIRNWTTLEITEQTLRAANPDWVSKLNRSRYFDTPETRELTTIQWSSDKVRFIWTDKRTWEERAEELDQDANLDGILYKAYRRVSSRGLIVFDWNLQNSHAMMMIRKSNEISYKDIRDEIEAELQPLIPIGVSDRIMIANSIGRIGSGNEVRTPSNRYRTDNQSIIDFQSRGYRIDLRDDPVAQNALNALGSREFGLKGDFYWLQNANLREEVHTRFYGSSEDDQRIHIWGEYKEINLRYVLQRIRTYCA